MLRITFMHFTGTVRTFNCYPSNFAEMVMFYESTGWTLIKVM